ncbi:MAG: hypothetical protein QNJ65_18825 [Xenococcaceae cyanobacterium MO_234.B1]|nr:hypothetical protein [Xenococcaceae cyanobacterium MO_234.B1]
MPYYQNPEKIPTLLEALNNTNVDQLKSLLSLLPVSDIPKRKAELVDATYRALQGDTLGKLWTELDELQQAAISEVVYSDSSQFEGQRFKAKYGKLPNFGILGDYYKKGNPTKLRLFFYHYDIIPEDIQKKLKAFVPPPKEDQIETLTELPPSIPLRWKEFEDESHKYSTKVEEIPLEVRLMEKTAGQDLQAVLRLIQGGKVSVSDKTRHPSKGTLNQITKVLNGGDFYEDKPKEERDPWEDEIGSIRGFSLALIVQVAGFAELSGKKLTLTKGGERALTAPIEKSLQTAWKKWLKTTFLDEFRRINQIKGQTGKGKRGFTALSGRRSAIVSVLEECPVNSWIEVDEFFRYIQATGQEFEVSRYREHLYICEAGYGYLYDLASWDILEERYTLCFLFEYAATLGLIDVAYVHPQGIRTDYRSLWGADDYDFLSRYDGLLYFRITPLGAYFLGITDTYDPPTIEVKSVLKVLPNLEIVATENSLTTAEQLFLEQYTEKVSDLVWQLDSKLLLDAVAKGHQLQDLKTFLHASSSKSLPDTVIQFLDDLDQRSRSLTDLGTARLIKCADRALAVLIANDSRTKKYCFLAGEDMLVIPMATETKFRNGLKKVGYSLPL